MRNFRKSVVGFIKQGGPHCDNLAHILFWGSVSAIFVTVQFSSAVFAATYLKVTGNLDPATWYVHFFLYTLGQVGRSAAHVEALYPRSNREAGARKSRLWHHLIRTTSPIKDGELVDNEPIDQKDSSMSSLSYEEEEHDSYKNRMELSPRPRQEALQGTPLQANGYDKALPISVPRISGYILNPEWSLELDSPGDETFSRYEL